MIKNKKANHLEFFEMRQSYYLPHHFEVITTPIMYNIQDSIGRWISDNLKGRYYIGRGIDISSDNDIVSILKVGFEDPKEASYFLLACPYLKYK